MLDEAEWKTRMAWVIPGAGSDACLRHLHDLIASQGCLPDYQQRLPELREQDLADPDHEFAAMFIEHVRDVYYGRSDTGAWPEIGYEVTG